MLLRSVLYTPSSSVRMIEKGLKAGADRVIIDLEDAVHVHNKEVARANLNQVAVSKRAVLRVNGLDTTWGKQDVQAAIALNYATIVLPKVNGKRDIEELVSITKGAVDIWAMIETPLGVLHANEIASCKQVSTLVLGTSDLAKELECETSMQRSELMTSFGLTLLAAKAYGKRILDGVHLDLSDTTGFEFACMQAKQLGFDGKTLIHPKTIGFTNQTFSPTAAQIKYAYQVQKAYENAHGIAVLDGKLIEQLHVDAADKIIAIGKLTAPK